MRPARRRLLKRQAATNVTHSIYVNSFISSMYCAYQQLSHFSISAIHRLHIHLFCSPVCVVLRCQSKKEKKARNSEKRQKKIQRAIQHPTPLRLNHRIYCIKKWNVFIFQIEKTESIVIARIGSNTRARQWLRRSRSHKKSKSTTKSEYNVSKFRWAFRGATTHRAICRQSNREPQERVIQSIHKLFAWRTIQIVIGVVDGRHKRNHKNPNRRYSGRDHRKNGSIEQRLWFWTRAQSYRTRYRRRLDKNQRQYVELHLHSTARTTS